MRNLLSANFLRLRKSALFWGTLVFMIGYALWQIRFWAAFRQNTIDLMIFDYAGIVGSVAAVWSSLFLGADYSDGTLRNKLVAGHARKTIYFANMVTNIAVALLQCAAYLAVTFSLGILLVGPPTLGIGRILSLIAGTLVMVVAFCAIFTAIGMLCPYKAAAAVVCIAGSFMLFGYMSSVDSYLNIPEYAVRTDTQGDQTIVSFERNDGYVSGTRRAVFEFLDNVLPSGQAVQYMRNRHREADPILADALSEAQMEEVLQHTRPEVAPLPLIAYSLAVTAAATAVGLLLFQRKNLK